MRGEIGIFRFGKIYVQTARRVEERTAGEREPPPPSCAPSRGKLWVGGGGRTGCIHTGGWCLFPVRAADFFSVCSLMCPSNTRGGKARKMINFFPIRETQAGKTRIFLPWPPSFRRVRLFGGRKKKCALGSPGRSWIAGQAGFPPHMCVSVCVCTYVCNYPAVSVSF